MRIKAKVLKMYWQLLIFPVLLIPYSLLNRTVIVNWLGCGCPKVDIQGNVVNSFNANDLTNIILNSIILVVIAITIFNVRNLEKWYFKLVYIAGITTAGLLIGVFFHHLVQTC